LSDSLSIDIEKLANRAASDKGYDVVKIELLTHLSPITIQLQIQPKGGGDVSIDDCASLNPPISNAFDQSQLLNMPYVLEISSPGISELLTSDRDFQTFKGFPIEVTYLDQKQSEHKKIGLLVEKSKDFLKLNLKGQISNIPINNVLKVRLTTNNA